MPDESREEQIEKRIDREVAGAVALAAHPSGAVTIAPKNLTELMEFAKLMSVSGVCVRAAFRGNPGACLALALQAFKWGADPFAVANKAYITTSKGGETQISYEAQLIHSIVNTRAALKGRLRPTYTGEGVKRACKITGWLAGEDEPFEYQSPRIEQISVKNSPLWSADPDQQLFYFATRAWARRHVPEILLGIYAPEEIGEIIEGEAAEIPERPRREDFQASEEREPPGEEEEDEDEEEEDEDEDEDDAAEDLAPAEPFLVVDAHGEEHQVDGAANAAEAFRAALEEAAKTRADLGVSACWENNAALVFELRERGYDQLADGLAVAYAEELAAADAAALPATPMKARAAVRGKAAVPPAAKIEVIKPKRLKEDRGWDWPAFAEAMIAAGRKLPRARLGEFRAAQASMFDVLRQSNKAEWARVNQALADHEREGTAA
jgi:hypothetical protein